MNFEADELICSRCNSDFEELDMKGGSSVTIWFCPTCTPDGQLSNLRGGERGNPCDG